MLTNHFQSKKNTKPTRGYDVKLPTKNLNI